MKIDCLETIFKNPFSISLDQCIRYLLLPSDSEATNYDSFDLIPSAIYTVYIYNIYIHIYIYIYTLYIHYIYMYNKLTVLLSVGCNLVATCINTKGI